MTINKKSITVQDLMYEVFKKPVKYNINMKKSKHCYWYFMLSSAARYTRGNKTKEFIFMEIRNQNI